MKFKQFIYFYTIIIFISSHKKHKLQYFDFQYSILFDDQINKDKYFFYYKKADYLTIIGIIIIWNGLRSIKILLYIIYLLFT